MGESCKHNRKGYCYLCDREIFVLGNIHTSPPPAESELSTHRSENESLKAKLEGIRALEHSTTDDHNALVMAIEIAHTALGIHPAQQIKSNNNEESKP